jgi:translation initiation factor IF-3
MDYGKFKFERKKKDKERKRNTKVVQTKTIKLRPKISGGDLNTKINQISKFLLEGNKVRVIVQFKGREISHKEIGKDLLDKIHDSMTAHCTLEVSPKMEGRAMTMVLAPGSE